ncbi:MAG TPA: formylglycine-generating enzyme family protein [Candidatus Dormibacteraeota bacterium]|nr:formylglycine-generating enzyme family protein [Candidatus Dormibacteraeota bacterium]
MTSRFVFRAMLAACFGVLATSSFGQSQPVLTVQFTSGKARLTVSSEAGTPCVIQYSTSLVANSPWVALSNFTSLATPTVLTDASSSPTNTRFYRALISVPSNQVWISAGTFVMGSPVNEAGRGPNSETQHTVTLTNGFFMSKFLASQANYLSLVHTNPSYYNTNHGYTLDLTRPVEQVSWFNATNYCALLTAQERTAGRIFSNWVYRLPTEAEWEYACRAGTTNQFYYGTNLLSGMANFDGEYEYRGTGTVFNASGIFLGRTTSVGSYQPNPRGLYDMAGNVWEWCADWYGTFTAGSFTNPTGPASGTQRVFRGGALNGLGDDCRSANRGKYDPTLQANTVGFRVVLSR